MSQVKEDCVNYDLLSGYCYRTHNVIVYNYTENLGCRNCTKYKPYKSLKTKIRECLKNA